VITESVLPDEAALAQFLRSLLSRGATLRKSSVLAPRGRVAIAEYGELAGEPRFLLLCNVPLGVYLGASLSLLSASVASEAVKADRLAESLAENLSEVFNVASRLFDGWGARIILRRVFLPGTPAPDEILNLADGAKQRGDYEVRIEGYGSGKLSLCAAAAVRREMEA